MELVKLKHPRKKVERKMSKEGLRRRRESSRIHMIKNNPMKKEGVRVKLSMKMKGRTTNPDSLFKKGNQYSKLRKKKTLKKFKGRKPQMKNPDEPLSELKEKVIQKHVDHYNSHLGYGKRNRKSREAAVIRLYKTGLSCPKVAERINRSKSFVTHVLRRNGIPLRKNRYWKGKKCPNSKSVVHRVISKKFMKENNPMKNPEIVQKRLNTMKLKYGWKN